MKVQALCLEVSLYGPLLVIVRYTTTRALRLEKVGVFDHRMVSVSII
jgi:hypothetical protein